jgi:hypothetical protein|tara:strand:- start:1345 stop:1572 length:228 start_codon:yes stop_codon:yes gene_type:complete
MANVVAIRMMKAFLKTGPKSTDQVYNHLNQKMKWGVSMSELGRLLANHAELVGIQNKNGYWRNKNETQESAEDNN